MDKTVEILGEFRNILQFSIIAGKSFVCLIHEKEENVNEALILDNSRRIKEKILDSYEDAYVEILEEFEIVPPKDKDELKISIIPNVVKMSSSDEVKLARYEGSQKLKHIFIGLLHYDQVDRSKDLVQIQDWLRNSIWLSCVIKDIDTLYTYQDLFKRNVGQESSDGDEYMQINKEHETFLNEIFIDPRVKRYILDIIVHLRMHTLSYKLKGGGVHPRSFEDIILLSKLIRLSQITFTGEVFDIVDAKNSTNDDIKSKPVKQKLYLTSNHIRLACLVYFPFHLQIIRDSSMDVSVAYGSKEELIDKFLEKLHFIQTQSDLRNPFFIQSIIIKDVLSKVIPPI